MELQHLVVKLLGAGRCFHEAIEIADVLAGFLEDPGVVVVFWSLMRGDDCTWIQRLNLVERSDPLPSCLRIGFGEEEVDVIVSGVAGDDESDGRDVQTGREVSVGMTRFHGDQLLPLQVNDISDLLDDSVDRYLG